MRLAAFVSLLAMGCTPVPAGPPAPPAAAAPGPPAPTATPLDALEQRLLSARSFRIHARLASGGRIESHFDGTLVAGPERRMRLAMQGAFGGKDVDALFVCDGATMAGGTPGKRFTMDAAPAVREGLAVTFARMGLLHDVARLTSGLPPDYLDGPRKHLRVDGLTERPGTDVRGTPTRELSWELYVDGERGADETLWIGRDTGLPLKRRVVVHFAEGDMEVGEEYDEVGVDEAEDDATFRVGP